MLCQNRKNMNYDEFKIAHLNHLDSPVYHIQTEKDRFVLCRLWFDIYLGFNITFNTVYVISRQVVLWAEETSTYS